MCLFDSNVFPAEASWPSGAASAQAIEAGVEVIDELSVAIEKLNKYNDIDVIMMDCIGYNQDMKSKVFMLIRIMKEDPKDLVDNFVEIYGDYFATERIMDPWDFEAQLMLRKFKSKAYKHMKREGR